MSISTGHPTASTASISHPFSATANPDWQHEEQETYSEDAEEIEEEDDDEVDQLVDESISEPDEITEDDHPVKEPGRSPGQTLLPAVRLENIMQADGVTGSLSLSREGMFVLSVATEEFIRRLTQGGHREAIAEGRSSINYVDMANTTRQYQEFMFLKDIIPPPISLVDALELREAREKEIHDEDPSLSTQPITSEPNQPSHNHGRSFPALSSSSSISNAKPKKSRSTNGKEKVNGIVSSASAGGMNPSIHESVTPAIPVSASANNIPNMRGQWVPGHGMLDARPWTHWADAPPGAFVNPHEDPHRSALVVNGSQSLASTNGLATESPSISRPGTTTGTATPSVPPTSSLSSSVSRDSRAESVSPVNSTTSDQQGQLTASGYLQGPGGPSPFSRPGANQGRTIYSQQS